MPNLQAMQKRNYALVARWGKMGKLVRNGQKRSCMIGQQAYNPRNKELFVEGAVELVIPAYRLAVPPDRDLDTIEWNKKQYRIVGPISGPAPDGTTMHYKCPCVEI